LHVEELLDDQEYEAVIREHSREEEAVDKNSPHWHQVPTSRTIPPSPF
jgi:hypothetical protein